MSDALLIFSRYPRLGRVKTRLQRTLGAERALDLHTAFLLDTLERTARLPARRHLFLADCDEAEAKEFAADGLEVHPQTGSDLGDRMWNAYRSAVRKSDAAVLIGADSPTLPLSYIEDAFAALREVAVAIGPAEDGGYYLLGLARPLRRLFYGIDWGTGEVLRQTLQRLGETSYRTLPPWADVDTPRDLARLAEELKQSGPAAPRRTADLLKSPSLHRRTQTSDF